MTRTRHFSHRFTHSKTLQESPCHLFLHLPPTHPHTHPPTQPAAPNPVAGGVTLSDPDAVCESTAEGSSCQGGLVGERPERRLCQAEGARGSPSGSWVGWGGQLWSSRVVGRREMPLRPEQEYTSVQIFSIKNPSTRLPFKGVQLMRCPSGASASAPVRLTPARLSSRAVATHLLCHLCPSAPSVTGSPSVSPEGTVGGGTDTESNFGRKCALDLSACIWTGQRRRWAARGSSADEDASVTPVNCFILPGQMSKKTRPDYK